MFAADWALAAIGRKLPAAVASKPRAEDSRNLRLVVSLAICQYPGKLAPGWTIATAEGSLLQRFCSQPSG